MICFQISIFEPLKTAANKTKGADTELWFAFKLVSLNHWKQHSRNRILWHLVVICFQISIFEPLKTANKPRIGRDSGLWFAFKLVSLNHWKQHFAKNLILENVVICFQISIFEPLKTAGKPGSASQYVLWFAFKLVSLNHWKQPVIADKETGVGCDLLSN